MEHGDIDQVVTARSVVTMVPTLVPGLPTGRRLKMLSMRKRAAAVVEGARFNLAMLRWIEGTARLHSHAFEVWHITPPSEYNRLVFDGLVEMLADYAQRGVVAWECYDEEMAMHVLMGSPHIDAIYDADHDRLERRWRFRGFRVPYGHTVRRLWGHDAVTIVVPTAVAKILADFDHPHREQVLGDISARLAELLASNDPLDPGPLATIIDGLLVDGADMSMGPLAYVHKSFLADVVALYDTLRRELEGQ